MFKLTHETPFAFFKFDNHAVIPHKEIENADYDLYPCIVDDIILNPNERVAIGTGIGSVIHEEYALIIENRSGIGVNKGLYPQAQTIDSGYRGEIKIAMLNNSNKTVVITHAYDKWVELAQDKITVINAKNALAQIYLRKVEKHDTTNPPVILLEEIGNYPSKRGENWAGSTNKY